MTTFHRTLGVALSVLLTFGTVACAPDTPSQSTTTAAATTVTAASTTTVAQTTTSDTAVSTTVTVRPTTVSTTARPATTTVTTTTTATAPMVNHDLAPVGFNSAQAYGGRTGLYDKEADAMRAEILNLPDTLKNKDGRKFYVSQQNGDDQNDGTSPDRAWKTLSRVSGAVLTAGDIVLFERGGVYRGELRVQNGVSYGAYGSGPKPALYNSAKNYATAAWTKDTKKNVYYLNSTLDDAGVVVVNHGKVKSVRRNSKGGLVRHGDYAIMGNRVYLCSAEGDPSQVFDSIEIGLDKPIVVGVYAHDVHLENLTLKYSGTSGISGNFVNNFTVRGCEIGWIGGSKQNNGALYGNGITWWGTCDNNVVDRCWIYQCYDAGWSFQGGADMEGASRQYFTNNLVEYCWYSTEMWCGNAAAPMSDIRLIGNRMRFAGDCFGVPFRPDPVNASHMFINSSMERVTDFIVEDNVFELGTLALFGHTSNMKLNGNTYVQEKSGQNRLTHTLPFDENAAATVRDVLGDQNATVRYYE